MIVSVIFLIRRKVGQQRAIVRHASVMLDMLAMGTTAHWTLTWMAGLMSTWIAKIQTILGVRKTTVSWFQTLTKKTAIVMAQVMCVKIVAARILTPIMMVLGMPVTTVKVLK